MSTTMTDLHTMRASDLPPQIHVGDRPVAERFAVDLSYSPGAWWVMPTGGLWTSSLTADGTTGWVDWCRREDFGDVDARDWWQVTPAPDARVLVIDGETDLSALIDAFPHQTGWHDPRLPSRLVSFAAIHAAGYAGLRLTEAGHVATRYLDPPVSTYTWDCESTVWLRWCFIAVGLYREDMTP